MDADAQVGRSGTDLDVSRRSGRLARTLYQLCGPQFLTPELRFSTPSAPPETDPGHVYARPARTGQRGLRRTRPLATDCPVHVRVRSWSSLVVASAKKNSPWTIS